MYIVKINRHMDKRAEKEIKNVKVSIRAHRRLLELKAKHDNSAIDMADLIDEILFKK